MVEFVHSNPNLFIDPFGETPIAVYYWVLRIGALVATTTATLSWVPNSDATFAEIQGTTDVGPVNQTSFEGSPTGKSNRAVACPSGSSRDMFVGFLWSRWWPWGQERRIKIHVNWRYSGGTLAGTLDTAGTGGTNPAAGFRVIGVSLSASRKVCECECHKYVPCVSGSVTVRTVYDQPFPMRNIDEHFMGTFTVCADGSREILVDYGELAQ